MQEPTRWNRARWVLLFSGREMATMNHDRQGEDPAQPQALAELLACRERANQLELENQALRAELTALIGTQDASPDPDQRTFLWAIMDNLPELIFFKDRESRFVLSNAAHLKDLGVLSMQEVIGKDDRDFDSPDVARTVMRDEQRIIETGIPILRQIELNPHADGTPRYFETSKFPWRDSSGSIVGTLSVARDITERILAEENLKNEIAERKRAEGFLDAIVDNLPTMLFVKDAEELRITRWNKAAEQITGLSTATALGKTDYDFFPREQADFFVAKDRETIRGGHLLEIAKEPLESAGHGLRYLRTKKIPILDENAKPAYLLGISEDITDAVLGEQRLQETEAQYRDLFENASDLIQSVSADGRYEYVNRRWLETLGYSESELAHLNFLQLIHPDEREHCLELFGRILAGQELPDIRTAFLASDGRKVYVEGSSTPRIVDGKVVSTRGIFHDVTTRRAAQEQAALQNAILAAQSQASPDGILVVGKDDRLLSYNQRFVEMWNMPPDALATGNVEVLRQAVQDNLRDTEIWRRMTDQVYTRTDASSRDEIEFKDGRYFERYSTPIKNEQDEYLGRVWYFHDITVNRHAEQATQRQNAYLQALNETSVGLMQRLDVNSLLQDIVARAGALVGTEHGYVFLNDPDSDEMELRVGVGAYEGFVGRRTRRGVGLAGQVWEQNAPVVVDDYRNWSGRLADASRDILRAVAGVPLRSDANVVGIIGLAYLDEFRKFDDAEIQVLQRFAQLATIALDNARLYERAQTELSERARAETALAEQLRDTELVSRVTAHAVSLDSDKALVEICREMAEFFGLEQAGIALFTEDRRALRVVADYSPVSMSGAAGLVIPVQGNPSAEIVLETRRAVAFQDAANDPRLAAIHELMRARGVASILIAPLFVRDEIIGTLGIDSYTPHTFTERDLALVERVALAISTALENARLYLAAQQELAERARAEQQLRQRNQELEVLGRVSAVMTTDIDTETALETLARELVTTFKARNCGIALLNPARTELVVVADALAEEHEEHAVGIVIPMKGNLSSQYVVENRRSLVIVDAQTDPMTAPIHERMRQRNTKCLAIIPLLSGGDVIGTIGLDTTDPAHIFNDEEIRLAETMANQMANAIEKQRLFDQTKKRAYREQLTREIGANMTRSLDMETILQSMARDLSRALGASHAVVRMGTSVNAAERARSDKQAVGKPNGAFSSGENGERDG